MSVIETTMQHAMRIQDALGTHGVRCIGSMFFCSATIFDHSENLLTERETENIRFFTTNRKLKSWWFIRRGNHGDAATPATRNQSFVLGRREKPFSSSHPIFQKNSNLGAGRRTSSRRTYLWFSKGIPGKLCRLLQDGTTPWPSLWNLPVVFSASIFRVAVFGLWSMYRCGCFWPWLIKIPLCSLVCGFVVVGFFILFSMEILGAVNCG
jgi:hypothetical protein